MNVDLERRAMEYEDRIGMIAKIGGLKTAKRIVEQWSGKVGEPVLNNTQVRGIAYILGYEEDHYDRLSDGPSGIKIGTFDSKIKPLFPEESKIDIGSIERKSILYKIPGVKFVMQELSPVDILYSDEDFNRALEVVSQ